MNFTNFLTTYGRWIVARAVRISAGQEGADALRS